MDQDRDSNDMIPSDFRLRAATILYQNYTQLGLAWRREGFTNKMIQD